MDLGPVARRAVIAVAAVAVLLVPIPPAGGHPDSFWAVSGTLVTSNGAPLAGANVTLVTAPCPVLPDPNDLATCPYVASTLTGVNGAFSVSAPAVPAHYWLFSHPTAGFGGDYKFVNVVTGPITGVPLVAWPYRPYGNATIVLPHYDLLSAYACNGQAGSGCGTSFQVPILSWTTDGAIYVNDSHDLVLYRFPNNTTQLISSAWTPLYQNFMGYGGTENTEWVTADGSFVYTVGCPGSCTSSTYLRFEAVNVSTGALVTHVWNVTAGQTAQNGQEDMVGLSGSYGYATLIDAGGNVHVYDLANRSEWIGGHLAFFEANNAYWIPELDSYVDVSAGGSSIDKVAQYRFNGSGFRLAYEGSWGSGTTSNFVNGLVYNLTAHEIYFEAGTYSGNVLVTDVLHVAPNRTIDRSTPRAAYGNPGWPERKWGGITPMSPEHRIATTAWGPTVAADFSPLFYNSSWLQDPTTGAWFDTNQSMDGGSSQADNAPNTVDGLFYNGSYAIDPASLYCTGTGNKNWTSNFCPLEGTFPNTTLGSIWWFWSIGQPMYPFPSNASLAQTSPPGAPSVEVASIGAQSITIRWTRALNDDEPLLNWTVLWGTQPGNFTNSTSLVPWANATTIGGLESGTRYYFGVVALNHHWFGPAGTTSGIPVGRPRAPVEAPTGLTLASGGAQPRLTWTNPSGAIDNVSIDAGPTCAVPTVHYSAGGNVTTFVVPSVPNGSPEWFTATAWGAAGPSGRSNCVGDAPGAPNILRTFPTNDTRIALVLAERSAPIFDHTVRYGPPTCDAFAFEASTGNGTALVEVAGLSPSAAYCFEVASWSYGGESAWSLPAVAATYGPILTPPLGVTAVPSANGSVVVRWVNPPGPVVNDTLLLGRSCAELGGPISTLGPVTSRAVGGLANGSPEWFTVSAWSPEGASPPSDCVSDAPSPPSIASAMADGPGSIALVASDAADPVFNHTVWYALGGCGAPAALESVGRPGAQIELTGLLPSTPYCLRLASWSFGGLSSFGAPVLVETLPAAPPAPLGLRLVDTAVDAISVAWSRPAVGISNLSIGVGSNCSGGLRWTNDSPYDSAATLGGLAASTRYCVEIRFWNGSLSSPSSSPLWATTRGAPPSGASALARPPVDPLPLYLLGAALAFLAAAALAPIVRGRRPRRPPPRSPTARPVGRPAVGRAPGPRFPARPGTTGPNRPVRGRGPP